MARLCLATREYHQAQNYFAHALLYRPNDPVLLYGLAQSSYYLADLETALAAARKAAEVNPGSPEIISGHALIAAASGQTETAQRSLGAFRTMEPAGLRIAKLEERIDDWKVLYSTPTRIDIQQPTAVQVQPGRVADSSGSMLQSTSASLSPRANPVSRWIS